MVRVILGGLGGRALRNIFVVEWFVRRGDGIFSYSWTAVGGRGGRDGKDRLPSLLAWRGGVYPPIRPGTARSLSPRDAWSGGEAKQKRGQIDGHSHSCKPMGKPCKSG
jgi:hypothetical protein